jgi:hypothetical protein
MTILITTRGIISYFKEYLMHRETCQYNWVKDIL